MTLRLVLLYYFKLQNQKEEKEKAKAKQPNIANSCLFNPWCYHVQIWFSSTTFRISAVGPWSALQVTPLWPNCAVKVVLWQYLMCNTVTLQTDRWCNVLWQMWPILSKLTSHLTHTRNCGFDTELQVTMHHDSCHVVSYCTTDSTALVLFKSSWSVQLK